jgi:hypothetical protein
MKAKHLLTAYIFFSTYVRFAFPSYLGTARSLRVERKCNACSLSNISPVMILLKSPRMNRSLVVSRITPSLFPFPAIAWGLAATQKRRKESLPYFSKLPVAPLLLAHASILLYVSPDINQIKTIYESNKSYRILAHLEMPRRCPQKSYHQSSAAPAHFVKLFVEHGP